MNRATPDAATGQSPTHPATPVSHDASFLSLLEGCTALSGASRASLWLLDENGDEATLRCSHPGNATSSRATNGSALAEWARQADGSVRSPIPSESAVLDEAVWLQGRLAGVVRLEAADPARVWTPTDRQVVRVLAISLSLALEKGSHERTRQQLRERERQLEETQAIAGIGIWEWDTTADTITWSDEQLRLHGLDRSWNPGSFASFLEIVHPDDRQRVIAECEDLLRTCRPFAFQYRIVRSDGTIRWMSGRGQLSTDADTGHVRMVGTSHDITERRLAEEALRNSEESYRTIFELAGDAVFVHDPMTGEILDANRKACELQNMTLEELRTRGLAAVSQGADPFTGQRARELVQKAAAGEPQRFEWVSRTADGRPFWVEVSLEGVTILGALRVVAVVRVITERKEAEAAIRQAYADLEQRVAERTVELAAANAALESEIGEHRSARAELHARTAELEAVFRALPDLYFRLRSDGTIIDHRYGSDDEQYRPQPEGFPVNLVGTNAFDFVPPWVAEKLRWALNEVARTDRLTRIEYRLPVEGDSRDYESRLMPLEDGTVVSVVRDVTEQKRTESALAHAKEAAERANRAKSEFLSRMSHELRTPMNSILGFAQVLSRGELTATQTKSVQHILRAGRHLLQLINEVLDIARIEAGRHNLSIEPVRVAAVLNEAIGIVRPLAGEWGVEIGEPLDVSREWFVSADRQRLSQVVLNLLSNAIKYNRRGGRAWFDCSIVDQSGDARLVIRVHDTGSGIAPDRLGELFTPFARLGAEQTEVEGTGLGLALSHRLAEAMGGELTLETTGPEGSTFRLALSVAPSPLTALEENGGVRSSAGETPHGPATILYIEDNLANLSLVETVLESRPRWRTIPALQGRLGLDLAAQNRPDLILLDIHLPDMAGDEVLRRLRSDERTAHIPVVVISADATQSTAERLIGCGVSAFLTKPLDIDEFLTTIERLLPASATGRR